MRVLITAKWPSVSFLPSLPSASIRCAYIAEDTAQNVAFLTTKQKQKYNWSERNAMINKNQVDLMENRCQALSHMRSWDGCIHVVGTC